MIQSTVTLCHFRNSPDYFSLLPMPFALNYMMVNEFPLTVCVGIDVGTMVAGVVSVEWVGNCIPSP